MRHSSMLMVLFAIGCAEGPEEIGPRYATAGALGGPSEDACEWQQPAQTPTCDGDCYTREGLVPGAEDRPPNVLILLADDIAASDISAYDEDDDAANTPHIDSLANDGVLFRNAYAEPLCSPARAELLTGRQAERVGIGQFIEVESEWELPTTAKTLPRMLANAPMEWSNAAVGKWHLTSNKLTGPAHPNKVCFDHYSGVLSNPTTSFVLRGTFDYNRYEKITNGHASIGTTYLTTDTANDAIHQLDRLERRGKPWLLYVAFNASHKPFQAPTAELTDRVIDEQSTEREMYLATIEAMDTEIGRILENVPEDTIIFFLADNGTPTAVVPAGEKANQSKGTLYERGVNVPFIVSGGPVAEKGAESEALVHITDIYPTVMRIAGVQSTPRLDGDPLELDGVDLLPALADPAGPGLRETVYAAAFKPNGPPPYENHKSSVRDERYKLMWTKHGEALYDLRSGIRDGRNLLQDEVMSTDAHAHYEALAERMILKGDEVRLAQVPKAIAALR